MGFWLVVSLVQGDTPTHKVSREGIAIDCRELANCSVGLQQALQLQTGFPLTCQPHQSGAERNPLSVSSAEHGIDLNSPCVQQPFWYVTLISMSSAPLPQFCRLNAAFTLQPKSPHFSVELSSSCWNREHRF